MILSVKSIRFWVITFTGSNLLHEMKGKLIIVVIFAMHVFQVYTLDSFETMVSIK